MSAHVNVGQIERLASVITGGALGLYGLARRSLAGAALAAIGGSLVYRGLTGHCPVYGALGFDTNQQHNRQTAIRAGHGVKVDKSFTINRSPEELYRFWRQLDNLPRFMTHLESVTCLDARRSHWVAKAPLTQTIEWDAEIITDNGPEVIGWRSLESSEVDTAGSVHFTPAPGGRGTEVRVALKYDPPAGKVGALIAKMLGEAPEQQIEEDLRRFKQIMEAGEVPTTAGQSTCR